MRRADVRRAEGRLRHGIEDSRPVGAAARRHLQGAGTRWSQAWPKAAGTAGRRSALAADGGDAADGQSDPRRHGTCRIDQLSAAGLAPSGSTGYVEVKGLRVLKEFRE